MVVEGVGISEEVALSPIEQEGGGAVSDQKLAAQEAQKQETNIRANLAEHKESATLEAALDKFQNVENQALQDELNSLFDAVKERYKPEKGKGFIARITENIRNSLSGIAEKRVRFKLIKLNINVSVGDLANLLTGVAIGVVTSTEAKKALYATTGIQGAAASAIVGAVLGGTRGGLRESAKASQELYGAETWREQIEAMEDPAEKMRAIELLLKNKEFGGRLKANANEAFEFVGMYQEIASQAEESELQQLLEKKAGFEANHETYQKLTEYISQSDKEKRTRTLKGIAWGSMRGAAFALAGYGLFKAGEHIFGGTPAYAEPSGHLDAGSAPGTPEAGGHHLINWRLEDPAHGLNEPRLAIDADTGHFAEGGSMQSIVDIEHGGNIHDIAHVISTNITHAGAGTEGGHFDMTDAERLNFEGHIEQYLQSNPDAIQNGVVHVPATELNQAFDAAHIHIAAPEAGGVAPGPTGQPEAPGGPPAPTSHPEAPVSPPGGEAPAGGATPEAPAPPLPPPESAHGKGLDMVGWLQRNVNKENVGKALAGAGFLAAGAFAAAKAIEWRKGKAEARWQEEKAQIEQFIAEPTYDKKDVSETAADLKKLSTLYWKESGSVDEAFHKKLESVLAALKENLGEFYLSKKGKKWLKNDFDDLDSKFSLGTYQEANNQRHQPDTWIEIVNQSGIKAYIHPSILAEAIEMPEKPEQLPASPPPAKEEKPAPAPAEEEPEKVRDLKAQIESDPDNPDKYNELGLIYFNEIKDPSQALPYFQEAAKLNPQEAVYQFNTGLCLGHLERYEEAIRYLQKAVELNPDYSKCFSVLGRAHYYLGQVGEAVANFARAIEREGVELQDVPADLQAAVEEAVEKAKGTKPPVGERPVEAAKAPAEEEKPAEPPEPTAPELQQPWEQIDLNDPKTSPDQIAEAMKRASYERANSPDEELTKSATEFYQQGLDALIERLGQDFRLTRVGKEEAKTWTIAPQLNLEGMFTVQGAQTSGEHRNLFTACTDEKGTAINLTVMDLQQVSDWFSREKKPADEEQEEVGDDESLASQRAQRRIIKSKRKEEK